MDKILIKSKISMFICMILIFASGPTFARLGVGGGVGVGGVGAVGVGGGRADFRGPYDGNAVSRADVNVNRVNVYNNGAPGHYYWNGAYYNYYYNGSYYNNCQLIPAHVDNGVYYPVSQNCW